MTWDPLGPRPKIMAAGRVVRNLTDDDEDGEEDGTRPEVHPFVAADANGDLIVSRRKKMPKGVYDRKPKTETAAEAPAKPKKRGRKPRTALVVPKVAGAAPNGSGRFDVALDLRAGAVTINAMAGSLTLAPDEVLALFAFLGRR